MNSLWTIISCSLRFIILDITGKNEPKLLSPENNYILKCLFLSTSKVPKKGWYHLHKKFQKNSWTLENGCFPIFSCSIIGEKIGQKFFSSESSPFFSKIWFFINLLGPKELILLLPQYLSDYLLDLYTSSFEVFHTRYYEKKRTPK